MKNKYKIKKTLIISIIVLIFIQGFNNESSAMEPVKLIVDGENITSLAKPIIENDRSLVPVRFIVEEIGGLVNWQEGERLVEIKKGDSKILLKIDSHLVKYETDKEEYFLSDISPKIINERTYLPLRLVSNALGIKVDWDENNRSININSNEKSDFIPIFNEEILTIKSNEIINGERSLKTKLSDKLKEKELKIKYLLIDPQTSKGDLIAIGNNIEKEYTWLPSIKQKGNRVLVAAIYDENNKLVGGDSKKIKVDLKPRVGLTGLDSHKTIEKDISLGVKTNFIASYVKYEIVNLENEKTIITDEFDPEGIYKWSPFVEESGNYSFQAFAYDENNKEYQSEIIYSHVNISPSLALGGVKEDMLINKAVNLTAIRNFNVLETEYILKDLKTGKEESLAKMDYGTYKWFPGPTYFGSKELLVRVKDTTGKIHESPSIGVELNGSPRLILEGLGPEEVIGSEVEIKSTSNVDLDGVEYILTDLSSGREKTIASKKNPKDEFIFNPHKENEGYKKIKVLGLYNGKEIQSEEIPIRIYLGKIYGPEPIIEKDKFLNLASKLGKKSWEETGMSASLQTAQAILETGWGQSVPVDKYTGQRSNNLFGIKGEGTSGSVISNTWEEYNGRTFRVDAKFRAYENINESWKDHKSFLLKGERYETFRELMHNSTRGAWALKRAGYATDSQYPIKLMNIIETYNLEDLDKIGI